MISNLIFVLLLALLTGYLTFITAKGGLTDNRFAKPWKRLTKRGKLAFVMLMGIMVTLALQELNNQKKNLDTDNKIQNEKNARDSIISIRIKAGVDSSRRQLFDDISASFAKQGLALDTLRKTITAVRDSTKTTINNYNTEDPVILIDTNGIYPKNPILNDGQYTISFRSVDQGSTSFKIVTYILTEYQDEGYDLSKINFFPQDLRLSKNGLWTTGFGGTKLKNPKSIIFYLKGSYTNLNQSKLFRIRDMYYFDPINNHVSVPNTSRKKSYLKAIESVSEKKLKLVE